MIENRSRRGFASAAAFGISTSDGFTGWLADRHCGLAIATYRSGRLYVIGIDDEGELSVFERALDRTLALFRADAALYVATRHIIWRFENALRPGQRADGCDALYVPQVGYVTGDVELHDLGVAADGSAFFANTRCNCIAQADESYSFRPVWMPPFIADLVADDRCHVSGVALADDRPRFATLAAESDTPEGWRERMVGGGRAYDLSTGRVVADELSLPNSPRIHNRKLWLLDSGNGFFGYVDRRRGTFQPVTFCPGFARGLSISGGEAVIGLSAPRAGIGPQDLPLMTALADRNEVPFTGLVVVDLDSGDIVHWLRFDSQTPEVCGVEILPGVRRPAAVAPFGTEVRRLLHVPPRGKT